MPDTDRRILIVAFDGLRPDMVSAELTPRLHALAKRGAHFPNSRAVFPSETRVNQASLVTGAWPERHGIVGNKFADPVASPGALIDSGDEDQLRAADAALDGALIDVPSLGEMLAGHGRQLAVIGSGTPGGTRMLNHAAERNGSFRLALYRPDISTPRQRIDEVIARLGPIPEAVIPCTDRLTYATDAYLDYVEPELRPDVTILWFFEPDLTFHYRGVGSPDSLTAIRHADAQLGRILDWRAKQPGGERLQVITLSDHGHVTTMGAPVDVAGGLEAAGFKVGKDLGDGCQVVQFCGSAGGIYLKDSDPGLLRGVCDWLRAQPWCGPLFTRDGDGALPQTAVGIAHRRAPDIAFITRANDAANAEGHLGGCLHDATKLPEGGGMHGGLHPVELSNWLAAEGDAFRAGQVSDLPCGIVDVLPTVLTVLGLPVPDSVQGRVLAEGLCDATAPAAEATTREHEAAAGSDLVYRVRTSHLGAHRYLERGWAETSAVRAGAAE